eukprot:9341494-Pyramimonas_sp.AAC.1
MDTHGSGLTHAGLDWQAMAFSPYRKFFEKRISSWETTLHAVRTTLDVWLQVQHQWIYLEPIFRYPTHRPRALHTCIRAAETLHDAA